MQSAGGGQCACELGQIRKKAAVADTHWVTISARQKYEFSSFWALIILGSGID